MNDGCEDGGQTDDDFPPETLAAIGRQVHWLLETGMGVAPATRDELAAGIEARADDAEMEGFERVREQCLADAGMLRDCPPFAIAEEEHVVTLRIGDRVVRRWSTWPPDADLVTAEAVWIVERLVRRMVMGGKTEALRDATTSPRRSRPGSAKTRPGWLAGSATSASSVPTRAAWAREAQYRAGVALAKERDASGWHAIDTAPKDGRDILVWGAGCAYVTKWNDNGSGWQGPERRRAGAHRLHALAAAAGRAGCRQGEELMKAKSLNQRDKGISELIMAYLEAYVPDDPTPEALVDFQDAVGVVVATAVSRGRYHMARKWGMPAAEAAACMRELVAVQQDITDAVERRPPDARSN